MVPEERVLRAEDHPKCGEASFISHCFPGLLQQEHIQNTDTYVEMIFEPAQRLPLPGKDLLSYIFDDPPYDQDEPVGLPAS